MDKMAKRVKGENKMKFMKKEKITAPAKKRASRKYASKNASFGVIAAVLGIMIATVAKGIELDKQEKSEAALKDSKENQI